MYSEEDLLPISGLQHLLFCPRQCALIHLERAWEENWLTAMGQVLHQRVDQNKTEQRHGANTATALLLVSFQYGLTGRADLVELPSSDAGRTYPYPVEYKRGKPKDDDCDRVQLCAQALCLEEMLQVEIDEGAFYYQSIGHREPVIFDPALRAKTIATSLAFHELIRSQKTPPPIHKKHCKSCSLIDLCLPSPLTKNKTSDYFKKLLEEP